MKKTNILVGTLKAGYNVIKTVERETLRVGGVIVAADDRLRNESGDREDITLFDVNVSRYARETASLKQRDLFDTERVMEDSRQLIDYVSDFAFSERVTLENLSKKEQKILDKEAKALIDMGFDEEEAYEEAFHLLRDKFELYRANKQPASE